MTLGRRHGMGLALSSMRCCSAAKTSSDCSFVLLATTRATGGASAARSSSGSSSCRRWIELNHDSFAACGIKGRIKISRARVQATYQIRALWSASLPFLRTRSRQVGRYDTAEHPMQGVIGLTVHKLIATIEFCCRIDRDHDTSSARSCWLSTSAIVGGPSVG